MSMPMRNSCVPRIHVKLWDVVPSSHRVHRVPGVGNTHRTKPFWADPGKPAIADVPGRSVGSGDAEQCFAQILSPAGAGAYTQTSGQNRYGRSEPEWEKASRCGRWFRSEKRCGRRRCRFLLPRQDRMAPGNSRPAGHLEPDGVILALVPIDSARYRSGGPREPALAPMYVVGVPVVISPLFMLGSGISLLKAMAPVFKRLRE